MSESRSERQWSRRDTARCVLVVLYVAVQVAVPLAALAQRGGFLPFGGDITRFDGPQVRFGWQMFATVQDTSDYEVRWKDGTTSMINSVGLLGGLRGRAHYAGVGERLCDRLPSAVSVARGESVQRC